MISFETLFPKEYQPDCLFQKELEMDYEDRNKLTFPRSMLTLRDRFIQKQFCTIYVVNIKCDLCKL